MIPLRWALACALAFVAFGCGSFAYFFVAVAHAERDRIDRDVTHELASLAKDTLAEARRDIEAYRSSDVHLTRFVGLFDVRGIRLAGNLAGIPPGLAVDGTVAESVGMRDDARGRKAETMRVAARVANGSTIVVGNDLDALDQTRDDLAHAVLAGMAPALVTALALGIALAAASQRRIDRLERAIDGIVVGNFQDRLPPRNGERGLDRIAAGVNRMLDAIARLYTELRAAGDDIAHELRTPLGRTRAALERARDLATTEGERVAIDRATANVDQALAVITAILRIGEIDHRERRRGFARVDLSALSNEVAELYAPIAEESGIDLAVVAGDRDAIVAGDRDLLFEALANLVDNAVKFSPSGGRVEVVSHGNGARSISVRDGGPGIPALERELVLERFVRGDKSRHSGVEGHGLGLGLVAAIVRLHEATLAFEDALPGCIAVIRFDDVASGVRERSPREHAHAAATEQAIGSEAFSGLK